MSTETTPNKPIRPAPLGQTNPPHPDAEARLRAISESQGVILDGKAWEHLLGAGKSLWDGDEDFERFLENIRAIRREG